ncbi:MAG: hypothetical protein AAGB93_10085 [Planctomycetota bacterium]
MTHPAGAHGPTEDAREGEAVLHDLKNLLTAMAALSRKAAREVADGGSEGTDAARVVLDEIDRRIDEAMRAVADRRDRQPAEGVDLEHQVSEHVDALGKLLGGADRFRVRTREGGARILVDIDEIDFLRVLVSVVRQAERSCTRRGELQLEVVVHSTQDPTPTRCGVLPPSRYAQLRVSCVGCPSGAEHPQDAVAATRIAETYATSLQPIEPILQEVRGGLRIVNEPRRCPAVEVLLPARVG